MEAPIAAQKAPYRVEVEEGKRYVWCACGHSAKQPFCDGAHKEVGLSPMAFVADKSGPVFLCGCKATAGKPFCDGTHKSL
jgi:CDGSH-type Zn-finger protein